MAVAFLNPGSTTLANAAWSDGSGFGTANAELVIQDNTVFISAALDQTGKPIDFLHVRGGAPKFTGLVSIEFDAAAATTPAFLWMAGGSGRFAFVGSNDADNMLLGGGTLVFESGEVGAWAKITGGTHAIQAGFTFGASAQVLVQGGSLVIEAHSGGTDVVPTLTVSGGTVTCRRACTTVNVSGGGTVIYDGPAAPTTVNLNGGFYRPVRNAGTTVNQTAGSFDSAAIKRATTVTNFNVLGGNVPTVPTLLTITNLNDFGAREAQTGQPLFA